MSWHFSQALVAEYSAANCSGGLPSAQLSGTDTPATYCSHGKTTDALKPSRSGMTCKPLTESRGVDVLTWYLAAFPVRTFHPLERAQESTESEAGCGDIWHESLARFDRDSSSWKTLQCSLLAGLDEFSETWPRWGLMRDGQCWAQSMPAHLTSGIESGLWPTPRASANENRQTMLTPSQLAGTHGLSLCAVVNTLAKWPTPTCHNAKEQDSPSEALRNTPTLCSQARGGDKTQPRHLNPAWVEWLMGWPLGWTDCAASATDKFQQWQHSHGAY